MNPRRELTLAVVLGAAGAGLALLAVRQNWVVEVTARPEPFPPERVTRTGGALRPWLPALAWVALAAVGVVLVTRGRVRRAMGGVLFGTGVAVAAGAAAAPAGTGAGAAWPLLTAAGGLATAAAGGLVLVRAPGWSGPGSRYERRSVPAAPRPAGSEEIWEALDRGEDPTAG